jgi:hypothetical protein
MHPVRLVSRAGGMTTARAEEDVGLDAATVLDPSGSDRQAPLDTSPPVLPDPPEPVRVSCEGSLGDKPSTGREPEP